MKKRDLILVGSILLVSLALLGVFLLTGEQGARVVVRVDGQQVASYSLAQDGEYPLNGGTNILCIRDGKAYLTDANCPDLLCVKQGKVSINGQTITCLPNKLTVTVYGAEDGVDLVA